MTEHLVAAASDRIHVPPVLGAGGYPVILDYCEALVRRDPGGLGGIAGRALAPTWEELQNAGVTALGLADFDGFEFPERAELAVQYRYLAGATAAALARSGAVVQLTKPHRRDDDDAIAVLRLIREMTAADAQMELALPRGARFPATFARHRAGIRVVREDGPPPADPTDPVTRLLALCQQGAPSDVLARAAGISDVAARGLSCRHVNHGKPWLWVAPAERRRVLASMSENERREGHARLFDAWPERGWGFLRSAPHAWGSRDPDRIARRAIPVICALKGLGPAFALNHIRALLSVAGRLELSPDRLAQIMANAAMLLPDPGAGRPTPAALPLRRRAAALATDPAHRIERLYDLANHHARGRSPAGLAEARRTYAEAFALLPAITDEERRILCRIRLLNGLALVAYHGRANEEALRLEDEAHALVETHAARYPSVARWAKPLLNTNTAKLLVTRFSDTTRAARYLAESSTFPEERIRRRALVDMARLAFDAGEPTRVVSLLDDAFATTLPDDNEADEALVRAMYAVAALSIGAREKATSAVRRLDHLSRVLDLEGGQTLVSALRRRIAASGADAAAATAGRCEWPVAP